MEKLYIENTYKKEFTAEIIDVIEKNDEYHIELDITYFAPQNEGIPFDTGYINSTEVLSIYEENDKIYHVVKVKPMKIHKIKCTINWETKFDYMQQHSGQHILSACATEILNANTLDYNFDPYSSYINIDKKLEPSDIIKIEEMANTIISDNIDIEIIYPTNSELKKFLIKKSHKNPNKKIRIVRVGELPILKCNGSHLRSTIEVQLIKISKFTKNEKGTRIEFLCGKRAVNDYSSTHQALERISKVLHCEANNAVTEIETIKTEFNKLSSEASLLKTEIANYEVQDMLRCCENIKDIRIIKSIYENVDLKHVSLLSTKLTAFSNVIVLFGAKFSDKTHLVFACSKDLKLISMNHLLKDAISLIDGKGGGSDFSAQGAGKNKNNLDSSLQYSFNKVKELIEKDSNI